MPCLNCCVKRWILLSLALVSTAWGQVDIQQIVRESIENYGHVWREEMNWVWIQTDVTASDDTNGTDVFEIAPIKGTPYERLIRKNGGRRNRRAPACAESGAAREPLIGNDGSHWTFRRGKRGLPLSRRFPQLDLIAIGARPISAACRQRARP